MSVFEKLHFDVADIKPPSVRIAHGTSGVVDEGKVPVGVVFRDDSYEILCSKNESFQFIPFWFNKQIVAITFEENQVGKRTGLLEPTQYQVFPHTRERARMITLEGKYDPTTNSTVFIKDQITFFIFTYTGSGKDVAVNPNPCQIVLAGANMKVARALMNTCYHQTTAGGRICDVNYSLTLTSAPVPAKEGKFYLKYGNPKALGPIAKKDKNVGDLRKVLEAAATDINQYLEDKRVLLTTDVDEVKQIGGSVETTLAPAQPQQQYQPQPQYQAPQPVQQTPQPVQQPQPVQPYEQQVQQYQPPESQQYRPSDVNYTKQQKAKTAPVKGTPVEKGPGGSYTLELGEKEAEAHFNLGKIDA